MTIFKHEVRQGKISLLIWTLAIGFMLAACVLIYPEMSSQMGDISAMFADMGSFSQAFGMDKLNFGEFSGFFGVECGNVVGIGGALFAALLGISSLAKEQKDNTAEFLLMHPVSRARVLVEKLLSVVVQIIILNLVVIGITALSILFIGEDVDIKTFALLFASYLIMQLEIGAITFGISAFIKRGTLGIGLGLAAVLYFLNIIANLTEDMKFIKYITPFGYTDGSYIIGERALNTEYVAVGIAIAVVCCVSAFVKYCKKDI